MHPLEETSCLFIPVQGLPLWNYIFPTTLILFPYAWTQRCHVYLMFCHDFPSWKPQRSGERARRNTQMSGGCSCSFPVVSQHKMQPADCNKATKSRKLPRNPPPHQTRLLIWTLLVSKVSGIKPIYHLYPQQPSKDGVNFRSTSLSSDSSRALMTSLHMMPNC